MEKVDKDVAAMLRSLKKYDQLVESVAPVLGMKTLSGKNVREGWQHDPTQGDRDSYGGYDRDIDIMRDEQADSEEAMIDFIQDKVSTLLKKYEGKLAEVGVYGDPDPEKIAKLLCDPEFDMVHFADELHDELHYLDQDGGSSHRAEPYIEDLMSDLEYIADEIKGNRMFEDDGMEEGNEFSGELAKAKSQHKDEFSVGGKTFPVKEKNVFHNPNLPANKQLPAPPEEVNISEQADPDVLAWMNRFAKLGNMKGYGR